MKASNFLASYIIKLKTWLTALMQQGWLALSVMLAAIYFISTAAVAADPPAIISTGAACGADYSAVQNNYGGRYNSPNTPNYYAFAALKADGSITAWGNANDGGSGAPADTGFVSIASNTYAFAALKADGSITAWGNANLGGSGAPAGTGFVSIASTFYAFAALKADGSITAWGPANSGAPADTGFVSIASTENAFAALKADGSITAWGSAHFGGSGAPADTGFVSIASTQDAFAALKADGSITAWGSANFGGSGAPAGIGFVSIASTPIAFAALKADGSITAWGSAEYGGSGAPAGTGFVSIAATVYAFAALKADGSITAWGSDSMGGSGAPAGTGFVSVASNTYAFAALKADGSIMVWGYNSMGGSGAPAGTGFVSIASNAYAFAALKADGSITAWGYDSRGGSGAPAGTGFVSIASNAYAFAALKADGSITAWGTADYGGSGAPTGTGFVSINGVGTNTPKDCTLKITLPTDKPPVIASDGGGDTASLSQPENQAAVTTVTSTDPDVGDTAAYSISGGDDSALFQIDPTTGKLTFNTAPDFENPADANHDNQYLVTVSVKDKLGASDTQALTITVTDAPDIKLHVRGFLQGAYVSADGLMRSDLATLGLLPITQPYGEKTTPFAYQGTETTAAPVLTLTGNNAPVDWVLVELRDKTTPKTRIGAMAGLLQRDGDVVDAATGSQSLVLEGIPAGDYYVTLRHRNHLGVTSAAPVTLSASPTTVDFTQAATATLGMNARLIADTTAVLWAGDANVSDSIIANGPSNDTNVVLGNILMASANTLTNSNFRLGGYYATDLNMDGTTIYSGPNNDINLLLGNVLLHPANSAFAANYILNGSMPK